MNHRNRHHHIPGLLLAILLLCSLRASATVDLTPEYEQHIDSTIYVGLITCQPSQDEVYSLYGHTAIHYVNKETGADVAINYGVFSMNQPGFAYRFMMGTALYTMDIEPFDVFCTHYARQRRGIVEQAIHMTATEKLRFTEALMENSLPQNRDYRYDYFYDNCSTRARNIILNSILGRENTSRYGTQGARVVNWEAGSGELSFRAMTHQYNGEHPWARFGNDILLGVKADKPVSRTEAQFLPDYLMNDFAQAKIERGSGEILPLVDSTKVVVPYFSQTTMPEFPLRPRECFLLLLVLVVIITVGEVFFVRGAKREARGSGFVFWGLDALLMTVCGLCGIVLFAMIFSKHPTVSLNLQLLLLNPLPLFFIWRMIRRRKKHLPDRQYVLWVLLICLFFIGNLWQTYAEGMNLVAAALLARNLSGLFRKTS